MKFCDFCGKKIGSNRKRFCSNECKDRWHNWHNPRGKFSHLEGEGFDNFISITDEEARDLEPDDIGCKE